MRFSEALKQALSITRFRTLPSFQDGVWHPDMAQRFPGQG